MTLGIPDWVESKISPEPNSGCWLWFGTVTDHGYGKACVGGHRVESAHRLVYELVKGLIPAGLHLDHLCRMRCCVNPDHLEPVTQKENSQRGIVGITTAARQRAKTHCPAGHEYTPENTVRFAPDRVRECRTCKNNRKRLAYHQKKGTK